MDSSQNIFLEKVQEQYQKVFKNDTKPFPLTIEIVSIDSSNISTHYNICNNSTDKNNTYTLYLTSNPSKLILPPEGNNYVLTKTTQIIEVLDYLGIYTKVFVEHLDDFSEDVYNICEIVPLEDSEGEYIY